MKTNLRLRLITVSLLFILGSAALQGCGLIEIFAAALGRVCDRPLVVSTTTDKNDHSCLSTDCSLREAVETSNDCVGRQTIQLPAGTYTLSMTGLPEASNRSGDLDIHDAVTIEGTEDGVTIDGNGTDSVLQLLNEAGTDDPVVIRNLTIRNGRTEANGGGISMGDHSRLELTDVVLRDNVVAGPNAGGAVSIGASGELVTSGVEIVGNESAGEAGGVFVGSGARFDAEETSIRGNVARGGYSGGGIYNRGRVTFRGELINNVSTGFGGGIINFGDSELVDSEVSDNIAAIGGAGVANFGEISIRNTNAFENESILGAAVYSAPARRYGSARTSVAQSRFHDNHASNDGGAVWNGTRSVLVVNGSSLSLNRANDGGAVYNMGEAYLIETSMKGNIAEVIGARIGEGGAIRNRGLMTVVRSTIADNKAGAEGSTALDGSGIYNEGDLSLYNVTVSGNVSTGPTGAAIFTIGESLHASHITVVENSYYAIQGSLGGGVGIESFYLANSVIDSNGSENCVRPLVSLGGNLFTDSSCEPDTSLGDVVASDPGIEPLADNGGSTQTHALGADSPAIDLGVDEECRPTDQRGAFRPFGDGCDAGAYEAEILEPTSGRLPEGVPTGPTTCRLGPRPIYEVVSYLSKGQSVQLLSRNEPATWVEVQTPDATVGPCWVDVDLLDIPPTVDLHALDLGYIPPEPTFTPTPEPEEAPSGPQQGCIVGYDQNQQPICQVPCPGDPQQYGGVCTK